MATDSLVIAGVRTVDGSDVDVLIEAESIQSVTAAAKKKQAPDGARVLPGAGLLVIPGFVDVHVHLDKAFTRDDLSQHDGTLKGAIRAMRERKAAYTPEEVAGRAVQLIRSSVAAGVTRIRSHVDIDSVANLEALEGVQMAAKECADLCEVQTVAFPQEGVRRDPPTRGLMERAVEAGVDLIGGMPHWEDGEDDQRAHVDFCFDLAMEADLDVDMHVDEVDDGRIRTLEMVADGTLARGWEGRVTAGHVCSLAAADHAYAARVIAKCQDAGMTIVSNPATNLMIQGREDRGLVRRGTTRIAEFRAAGVNLCFGQDNVCDGFYPFGRGDMLEVALVSAHAAHLTTDEDLLYALACVTEGPARIWPETTYGIRPGARADLSLFRAPSWQEALRLQRPPELVLFRGRPVAKSVVTSQTGSVGL
jgi:cytosine deaminase